ncbi:Tetratricopeptide repeat-containing protein [Amycolatopsis sacchari]|uniref:Tetratricopeptide repeat-containing protein n=1 Tax=Amycolatopsis sacchari TaxID=115433 RepID=A0A1I3VU76_9PSEU|nr:tetratricopeptide repeat protein [Amycolatopsis sacchari]SFJ97826.1 Tetratricopeptide repeat-containing protein [Amycolatopsis sacchari]
MTELGQELRRRRLSAGLSLAALAATAHFTKGYLSKVETGRVRVNRGVAEAYDKALGAGGELAALVPVRPPGREGPGIAGLPAGTRHFLGRESELAALSTALVESDDVRVCVVHGMAGAGKTALAVAAARAAERDFPDGSVFLDLRGHTPGASPLSAEEALRQLLRLFEVPAEEVPTGLDARANLFRGRLRGRKVLLVLDNARSAAQIAPLLPGEPACRVLVTSRNRLSALDDAWHQEAGLLDPGDAVAVLRAVGGVPADEVAAEVAALCGRLPLALRIAGARLAAGGWTPERLRRRLAGEHTRLAALDDGERGVAAAFAVSYEGLPEEQRRLFGLLAVHPAAPAEAAALEALAGAGPGELDHLLDRLHDAHLVTLAPEGLVGLHDLVRAFALRHARPGTEDRRAAVGRLTEYATARVLAADEAAEPDRYRPPVDCERAAPFPDADTALAWLREQWPVLAGVVELAGEYGLHRRCAQLALLLRAFFFREKLFEPWLRTHRVALEVAADDATAGMLLNNLGMAHVERGELAEAADCHRRARERCLAAGDERGAVDALSSLAWVRLYQGEVEEALRGLEETLSVYRAAGRMRNVEIAMRGRALALTELRRFAEAAEQAAEARSLARRPPDVLMAVNCQAWIAFRRGEHEAAERLYTEAAELADLADSRYERARALTGLGNTARARGDAAAAARWWAAADGLRVDLPPVVLGEARVRAG